jgi:hypothetical protein
MVRPNQWPLFEASQDIENRFLGDRKMQQLSVHDYYDLGKKLNHLERIIGDAEQPIEAKAIVWQMFIARWTLRNLLGEQCALLPSSQRAAKTIIKEIDSQVPQDFEQMFNDEVKNRIFQPYQLSGIKSAITNFETILKNDMPEMATFAVAQVGLFRTEDLINRSHLGIEEDLRSLLPELAKQDIIEAGKCLAYRVPTAAAFHLSRAIETGMNHYYETLAGKPFDLNGASKNWAVKTDALKKAGAEQKITEFLIHIRKAYRNPITHPDVILEPGEAFAFFPHAVSVISMMLAAIKELRKNEQPVIAGLFEMNLGSAMLEAGLGDELSAADDGEEAQ